MQATNPNGQTRPVVPNRGTKPPAPNADTAQHQGKPTQQSQDRFLRLEELIRRVGLSSTSIYNFIAQGRFPAQIKLGRTSVWSENAINQWMEEQKAGGAA